MKITARHERWPIAGAFTIARGAKSHADVVLVELEDELGHLGRGECVPYARYGETIESVLEELRSGREPSRGAARSGLDLARWDLRAKQTGRDVASLAGLTRLDRIVSAITISLDTPEIVGACAETLRDRPLLKIKLAGDGLDLARVCAIRESAPGATLWVDANESWDSEAYDRLAPELASLGVALIEQPLPADRDLALRDRPRPVPVCADESAHGPDSIAALADRYDAINVKLDKAGGLTGAIAAIDAARASGMKVVLGCMVSTSLAIAPACLLASRADWVDLDGSVLLASDREGGARIEGGALLAPARSLWGG